MIDGGLTKDPQADPLRDIEDMLDMMESEAREAHAALRALAERIADARQRVAALPGQIGAADEGVELMVRPLRDAVARLGERVRETVGLPRPVHEALGEARRALGALSDALGTGVEGYVYRSWRQSVLDAMTAAARPMRARDIAYRVAALHGTARTDEEFDSLKACVRATLHQFKGREIGHGLRLTYRPGLPGEPGVYLLEATADAAEEAVARPKGTWCPR